MISLCVAALLLGADPPPEPGWADGEHATGEWGGARTWLSDHGVTLDLYYSAEVFFNTSRPGSDSATLLGHVDAAITLETRKLGLWPGGRLYVLGQNNHGRGVNEIVGSDTAISNYEAQQFTQLTEFFYEQSLLDDHLRIRLGKQDANREFGSPRYGGNFINNNFGMFPTTPLPSYPTTGLGAAVIVEPTSTLALKAVIFEGNPQVGSWGFDSALAKDGGFTTVLGAAFKHLFGEAHRNGGTTSAGVWWQSGVIPERTNDPSPRTFSSDWGFFVQDDERLYSDPSNPDDPRGLNLILRFAWSMPDRTDIPLYGGASLGWHGLGTRDNDTVGIGGGAFTVSQPLGGSPGPRSEVFVEAFYKMRLTHFLSLQPDLELYRHPGGDGPNAVLAGLRVKLKL